MERDYEFSTVEPARTSGSGDRALGGGERTCCGPTRARRRSRRYRSCSTRVWPTAWCATERPHQRPSRSPRHDFPGQDGPGDLRQGHQHHLDTAAPRRPARKRSMARASPTRSAPVIEDGVDHLAAGLRLARQLLFTTTGHAARGTSRALASPSAANLLSRAGQRDAGRPDGERHQAGPGRHRADRHGRQRRDRRLQPGARPAIGSRTS